MLNKVRELVNGYFEVSSIIERKNAYYVDVEAEISDGEDYIGTTIRCESEADFKDALEEFLENFDMESCVCELEGNYELALARKEFYAEAAQAICGR